MSPLFLLLVVLGAASVAQAADAVPLLPSPIVVQKQFALPPVPPVLVLPPDPRSRVESLPPPSLPAPRPRSPDGLFQGSR